MQIPVLLGREIDERDLHRRAAVAVVNQEFARTYFTNKNPVGQHFSMGMMGALPDLEIVGVSRDARYNSLKQDIAPTVYLPYSTNLITLLGGMVFEVRVAGDPNAIAQAARTAVRKIDANVPISDISTQAKRINQAMSQERTFATLCTCFALLAVLIACVGLYGTMAYAVARRTSEIGIRVALGGSDAAWSRWCLLKRWRWRQLVSAPEYLQPLGHRACWRRSCSRSNRTTRWC